MNIQDVVRSQFASTYVEEQRIARDLSVLLDGRGCPADHPSMPHRTSARILLNHYKSVLRGEFFYVRWEFCRHRTLGMIVEDYRTAIRWLWVVDFKTLRSRRLAMVM